MQPSGKALDLRLDFHAGDQPAKPKHPRAGELCPYCGMVVLDYDGMLNLVCPYCGFTEGGCFT